MNLSCLPREDAMLTSAFSPVQEIQLLADRGLNVYSMTAAGGALEGAVRGKQCLTLQLTEHVKKGSAAPGP